MQEDKRKHLEMIQSVINRLSTNSFLLKGWSVLLVSGMLALAVNSENWNFVYLAFLPVIALWVLDGFFLWQERLYRNLYDEVRQKDAKLVDFSMSIHHLKHTTSWLSAIFSRTLVLFHGILFLVLMIISLYSFC